MAFVKFTETGKSFAPRASINPRGYLSFNDGTRKRYGLEKYGFAVLYYDAEESKVGVELTNDETAQGAVKLRHRQTGATIGAKSFIDFFDIRIEKTTVYDVRQGEGGLLLIDLEAGRERNSKDDEDLKDEEEDPLA